jgi:hypothetical protein
MTQRQFVFCRGPDRHMSEILFTYSADSGIPSRRLFRMASAGIVFFRDGICQERGLYHAHIVPRWSRDTRIVPRYLIATALGGDAMPPSRCNGADTIMNSYRLFAAQSSASGARVNNSPNGSPSNGSAR